MLRFFVNPTKTSGAKGVVFYEIIQQIYLVSHDRNSRNIKTESKIVFASEMFMLNRLSPQTKVVCTVVTDRYQMNLRHYWTISRFGLLMWQKS